MTCLRESPRLVHALELRAARQAAVTTGTSDGIHQPAFYRRHYMRGGTAHNLLSAMIDNHIQQGNTLNIDPRRIVWRRVMDMNDRALRDIVIGLGGTAHGVPRETGFDITVASEVMAIFCLADSLEDLKGPSWQDSRSIHIRRQAGHGKDIKAEGAMTALLRDAITPTLSKR